MLILELRGLKGVRKQGSDKEAKVQMQDCAHNFCKHFVFQRVLHKQSTKTWPQNSKYSSTLDSIRIS